jgi:hypothetical protein
MDYKFIILAIVGIIIAYIIYSYTFSLVGTQLIKNTIYLNSTNTTPIYFNTLGSSNFTSANPTFYAWIYVNKPTINNKQITTGNVTGLNNIVNKQKLLFYMNTIGGTSTNPIANNDCLYSWALDQTGTNLYVTYNTSSTTIGAGQNVSGNGYCVQVSNNIPIQTWVFVAVVLDNTASPPIMDIYINGKLASSQILPSGAGYTYSPPTLPTGLSSSTVTSTITGGIIPPSTSVSAIQFGSSQDVYISNLTINNGPMTPDQIQNAYLSFAGNQNSVANATMHYGISISRGSGLNSQLSEFKLW